MFERFLTGLSSEKTAAIFGSCDVNAAAVEKEYGVIIGGFDGGIKIVGENEDSCDKAYTVLEYLANMLDFSDGITEQSLNYAMSMINDGGREDLSKLDGDCICITHRGKPIKAKTVGQKNYASAIFENTVVFGIGPAGTGKTFLAVAMAVNALKTKAVSRIILTRPAVEAGEKLGFLPGDMQNKIDPYLRPLYDALFEMIGAESYAKYVEKGAIEVAPLAYMRGRTLDDSFIILDEAQNTTPEQMKMFLTRLGFGSKMVVTGDVTQIDLPDGKRSGLIEAANILSSIEGIKVMYLSEKDIVRHALVGRIISAYARFEERNKESLNTKKRDNDVETHDIHEE